MLGWGVRPLRPADHLRRLRRRGSGGGPIVGEGRQGGHGRNLVFRHHSALHRGNPAAAPRGYRADVRDRRHLRGHRLPGRDLQLRLRPELDRGAPRRRPARPEGRPALRARARAQGRPSLQGKSALAPADPGRTSHSAREPLPHAFALRPARSRAVAGALTCAGVLGRPVPRRADRRALRPGPERVERAPRRVPLAPERRARGFAGAEHDHPLGRVHEALRGRRGAPRAGLRAGAERGALPVPG